MFYKVTQKILHRQLLFCCCRCRRRIKNTTVFFFHKETLQPQERFQMDTSGRGMKREMSK